MDSILFILIFLFNVANSRLFDSAKLWSVKPDHVNIPDFAKPFRLEVSPISRKFLPSDYFVFYYGTPDDLWYSSKIYPNKIAPINFMTELGNKKISLVVEKTDTTNFIVFRMHFQPSSGNTLTLKFGPSDEILFLDTLDITDTPSVPKITILKGDVREINEDSRIKVQCTAKNLGVPAQTLEIEIPGLSEETTDHSDPHMLIKTFFLNPEDDGKPIRCHLGKQTTVYRHNLNIYYGPMTPIITNPLGETEVVFPGEYLECLADAKPPAVYKWIPMHDVKIANAPIVAQGNKLLIMDNKSPGLRKKNFYQFTCEASNILPGTKEKYVNSKSVTFLVAGGKKPSKIRKVGFAGWDSGLINSILIFGIIIILFGIMIFVAKWHTLLGYENLKELANKNTSDWIDSLKLRFLEQFPTVGVALHPGNIENFFKETIWYIKNAIFKKSELFNNDLDQSNSD